MRTPYGAECQFYYEDFARGRNRQECRLVQGRPSGNDWTPGLCKTCPVPAILRANACPNMVLEGAVKKRFLGLSRNLAVTAFCTKAKQDVAEPQVGCGQCHGDSVIAQWLDQLD